MNMAIAEFPDQLQVHAERQRKRSPSAVRKALVQTFVTMLLKIMNAGKAA